MLKQSGLADVYTDFNGLAKLKGQAKSDPRAAAKETGKQFESLFIQMSLKSMRDASGVLKSNLIDSRRADTFREMYDQQMAVELGKQSRLGLGDMITRQINGDPPAMKEMTGKSLADYRSTSIYRLAPATAGRYGSGNRHAVITGQAYGGRPVRGGNQKFDSHAEFAAKMWPHAQAAAAEIGVDPKILLAQAALETGWGKSLPKKDEGSAYNLFGIKADRSWKGDRVTTGTSEFENGAMTRTRAAFRAYGGYQESFQDYVRFLKSNPRYATALQNADNPHQFVKSLQKAGYATDPAYARKILAIYENSDAFTGLPGAS